MKRILVIMLASVSIVSLAACSNSNKNAPLPDSEQSSSVQESSQQSSDSSVQSEISEESRVKTLSVRKPGIDLKIGSKYSVELFADGIKTTNSSYVWKSEDPSVAEVNSQGIITAKSGGYTTVTVGDSKYEALYTTINVHVEQPESSSESSVAETSDSQPKNPVTIINQIPESTVSESSTNPSTATHFNPYLVSDGIYAYNYVSEPIPDNDLQNFSSDEVQFLLNVIAAKHGYRFHTDKEWKAIFEKYDWYNSISKSLWTYNSPDVNERMTSVEQSNNQKLMDRKAFLKNNS